jgi:PAS domain S-box-containing protein
MGVALFAFTTVIAFSAAVVWAARLLSQSDTRRRQTEEALRRERSLVGLLRSLADAANQSSFDQALARTLEVFVGETSAPWGMTIRFGSASKGEAEVRWFPRPQGATPDAVAYFLIEHSRQLSGPTYMDLPAHLGLEALQGSELIPIHDGNDVAGVLFLAGPAAETEERKAARAYAREQLSRSAERHRTHQKLSDALSRHEALFSSVSEGIITINESNTIERFNPAAEAMFGYSFSEVERRDFSMLLDEAVEPGGGSLARRLLSQPGGPRSIAREAVGRRKDGTLFPAELSLSIMLLGNRNVFVAFVRDISERKTVERMQAEFVSTVSHELRTPLTSIGGSLGLIVGGAAGDVGDRAKRLIGIAHTNTQRLIRLVNDILDIEKLQSGQMSFRFGPIDLDELVGQVIASNVGYAESFGVTVVYTGAPADGLIQADRDRLNQAITNLVSNAVKFSPPGGAVEISAAARGSMVRISVADHGPGIPEAFQGRIFERFAQADSSDTRPKGGSGLGLSIAREIVQRHGGSLSFETVIGSGTVFHLDLPRIALAKHEPLRAASIDQSPSILVCANEQSKADAICTALAGQGFGCVVASRVEEALTASARAIFRAAVIEVPFGGIDIAQFVPALREQSGARALPLIVVSLDDSVHPASGVQYAFPIVDWVTNRADLARLPEILRSLAQRSFPDRPRILHVEDDPDVLEVVSHALDGEFTVVAAPSLELARQHLACQQFELVILDLTLSDGLGKDLIPALVNAAGAPIPTVVFTAQDGTPELAANVEAVLTKSRANLTTLLEAVRSVVKQSPEQVLSEKEAEDEQPQSALRR